MPASVTIAETPSVFSDPEKVTNVCDVWEDSSLFLERLFDPYNFDHLPIEDQVKLFKQRNLLRTKFYKTAAGIWGAPLSRKRVINAPPMRDINNNDTVIVKQPVCSALKPQVVPPPPENPVVTKAKEEYARFEDYKAWVNDRKKFRNDLDNMGLSEQWLAKKIDRTVLEERVLRRMIEERTPKAPTPEPVIEEPVEAVLPNESPVVRRPSPLALRTIERFLARKKMRLIDLFATVDKDKKWMVSRTDFRRVIRMAKIPMPDALLEDLIMTLDLDHNDQLDYRELAKGMGLWKAEKRHTKRINIAQNSTAVSAVQSSMSEKTGQGKGQGKGQEITPADRATSTLSTFSSKSAASSKRLEPPGRDLRPEVMPEGSPEAMLDLRKRDKEALARMKNPNAISTPRSVKKKRADNVDAKTMIKTGDVAVDAHSLPATLTGDVGEMVDKFRALQLKEYNEVLQLCQDNNVPLSVSLLNKVLLYPPDKPHSQMIKSMKKKQLAIKAAAAASIQKKKRPLTSTPIPDSGTAKVMMIQAPKPGKVVIDSESGYPRRQNVSRASHKMNLSTGKAVITRQVDCWVTFEEFTRLTSHLASRYTRLHGASDDNAFWPGHLLNKLRLCMPNNQSGSNALFTKVTGKPQTYHCYHKEINWPKSDRNPVTHMSIDSHAY